MGLYECPEVPGQEDNKRSSWSHLRFAEACLNPLGDLVPEVKLPQLLTCGVQVSCPLECSVQPLYEMPRWYQACGSVPVSWEDIGTGQRELYFPVSLFAPVSPHPRWGAAAFWH